MLIVELLPDAAAEAWIREDWAALEAVDCPNLSRHRSPTNRPHLTVSAHEVASTPASVGVDEIGRRVRSAAATLPLTVPIGPPAVFGDPRSRRGLILVRTLVVTESLLAWRRAVIDLVGPAGTHPEPDWVPHLSLARGLTAEQVGEALTALPARGRIGAAPAEPVVLHEIRLWDADARRVVEIDTADRGGPGSS